MKLTFPILSIFASTVGLIAWQALAQEGQPTTQPGTQPATEPAQAPAEPGTAAQGADAQGFVTGENGLRYKIVQAAGEPSTAQKGDVLMVHYTGRFEDGTEFDSSLTAKPAGRVMQIEPFIFTLGQGRVIPGWEKGLEGMKVGEKRTLVVPPALAYGDKGAGGGLIPPNATLVFDVELVGLWRPEQPAAAPPGQ